MVVILKTSFNTQRKEENELTISVSPVKQIIITAKPVALVFRYIPKSHRKDSESPFSECTISQNTTKADMKFKETNWHILKAKGVLPVYKTKASLPNLIAYSKGSL